MNTMAKMRKRSGAGLLLALFILLLGGGIVGMMYGFTNSFFGAAVEQRNEYRDDILASSYIERAKGWIIATNLESGRVEALKGTKVSEVTNVYADLRIPDSGDLNITETVDGRRVEVAVYDANYRSLAPSFNQYDELPPSLAYSGGGTATGGFGGNEAGDGTYIPPESDNVAGDTKKFGAYVIRVKIFDAVTNNLIRETETGFFQVIP